jgi:hypothetical protein
MPEIQVSDQPKLLEDILASLNQAVGGASQLAHSQRDPRWLFIREIVECTQGMVLEQATFAASKISLVRPS